MFSVIWKKIREVFGRMTGQQTIEKALAIKPSISDKMTEAIKLWGNMYKNKAPWLKEPSDSDPIRIASLGLPAFIANEKARMATLEMKSEITAPVKLTEQKDELTGLSIQKKNPSGSVERAEFLNEQYKNTILKDIRVQLEYGIAKGGLVIKPYAITDEMGRGRIAVDYIQPDGFYPIEFNASGEMISAAFVQRLTKNDDVYSRVEFHRLNGNTVTVINKAYKASKMVAEGGDLGREISLSEVQEWTSLEPETVINNVERLLFAYFKMPIANTIDTYSPLGVSAYSRAVDLIKDADNQYSRLLWEFEAGEMAVNIDKSAINSWRDENGKEIVDIPQKQKRMFEVLDFENPDTWNFISPALRDSSYINGLNNILMRIEDVCGLARGTIADVSSEARTATEIAVLKQRSYASNAQIQEALERALRDTIYVMDVYATLYNLAPLGEYEVSFEWDDSIQTDRESEMSKRMSLMQNGLYSKVEYRMWFFGESEEQAIAALAKIQQFNSWEAGQVVQRETE